MLTHGMRKLLNKMQENEKINFRKKCHKISNEKELLTRKRHQIIQSFTESFYSEINFKILRKSISSQNISNNLIGNFCTLRYAFSGKKGRRGLWGGGRGQIQNL